MDSDCLLAHLPLAKPHKSTIFFTMQKFFSCPFFQEEFIWRVKCWTTVSETINLAYFAWRSGTCFWLRVDRSSWFRDLSYVKLFTEISFRSHVFFSLVVSRFPRWSGSTAASRLSALPGSSRRRLSTESTPGSFRTEVRGGVTTSAGCFSGIASRLRYLHIQIQSAQTCPVTRIFFRT